MDETRSLVLEFPAPAPAASRDFMAAKLAFHTDAWDVAEDREMSSETTRDLDPRKTYVVYCDGIGCNASTKGAYRLAALGFRVKELLGGLDFWVRDGHAVTRSEEAGQRPEAGSGIACGCA